MQGPWENNTIYTLKHSAESGDMLWNVISHRHESAETYWWEEKEKYHAIKGKEHVQSQRDSMGIWERCLKHRVQKRKSLRRRLGPCYKRPGIPRFAVIPGCHPRGSLSFISSFTHSSEEQHRQGHRMERWEPTKAFNKERGRTSTDKESWDKVGMSFPAQGSVIRLNVEPLEGGVKRLHQQKWDKGWALCAWELSSISGMWVSREQRVQPKTQRGKNGNLATYCFF